MAKLIFPNALTDLMGVTSAITESDLDWTIASIIYPTDKPARGTLHDGFLGRDKIRWAMTHADIAAFLVSQVTDTTFSRAAPAISN